MEVYTRNMTDDLFVELLYELENVINVTDRGETVIVNNMEEE